MATHFSVLTWEIRQTEEPGGLQSMGSQESNTLSTHMHIPTIIIKAVESSATFSFVTDKREKLVYLLLFHGYKEINEFF